MSSSHDHEQQFLRDNVSFVVWKDLEKENKEFFEAYWRGREEAVIEMQIRQMIRKLQQSESSAEDTGDRRKLPVL